MPAQFTVPGGLHVEVPTVPASIAAAGKMTKGAPAQSVPDSAIDVPVTFNAAAFDTAGTIVDVANDQFIVPADGVYAITAIVEWDGAVVAAGFFSLKIAINGLTDQTAEAQFSGSTLTVGHSNVLATTLQLAAGDLVTFVVRQVTGDAQDINAGEATISRVA